jgi:hypothetical protein
MAEDAGVVAEAEAAVAELLAVGDAELFEQLGLRSQLVAHDLSLSTDVVPGVREIDELVSRDELRELGKRIFDEMNAAAWHLVCGSDAPDTAERRRVLESFSAGPTAVGAYLTVALIGAGISPFFAPVVASIVIKLFLKPTYEATCDFWKQRL